MALEEKNVQARAGGQVLSLPPPPPPTPRIGELIGEAAAARHLALSQDVAELQGAVEQLRGTLDSMRREIGTSIETTRKDLGHLAGAHAAQLDNSLERARGEVRALGQESLDAARALLADAQASTQHLLQQTTQLDQNAQRTLTDLKQAAARRIEEAVASVNEAVLEARRQAAATAHATADGVAREAVARVAREADEATARMSVIGQHVAAEIDDLLVTTRAEVERSASWAANVSARRVATELIDEVSKLITEAVAATKVSLDSAVNEAHTRFVDEARTQAAQSAEAAAKDAAAEARQAAQQAAASLENEKKAARAAEAAQALAQEAASAAANEAMARSAQRKATAAAEAAAIAAQNSTEVLKAEHERARAEHQHAQELFAAARAELEQAVQEARSHLSNITSLASSLTSQIHETREQQQHAVKLVQDASSSAQGAARAAQASSVAAYRDANRIAELLGDPSAEAANTIDLTEFERDVSGDEPVAGLWDDMPAEDQLELDLEDEEWRGRLRRRLGLGAQER